MTAETVVIDTVVDPITGEILSLDAASVRDLAMWIENTREVERSFQEPKRAVYREVHRRMDAGAKWTLEDEEYVLKGDSPAGVTYDAPLLYELLAQLVVDDLISEAASEAACERTYAYSAKVHGINALRKLGGAVASAIEACATPIDPAGRRVRLSRKGMVR